MGEKVKQRDINFKVKYVIGMVAVAAIIVPILLSISLAIRYAGTDELVGKFAPLFGIMLSTIFVPLYFLWHIADVVLIQMNQKRGLPTSKINIVNLSVLGGFTLTLMILIWLAFNQAAISFVEYFIALCTLLVTSFFGHKLYFKVPDDDETQERFF